MLQGVKKRTIQFSKVPETLQCDHEIDSLSKKVQSEDLYNNCNTLHTSVIGRCLPYLLITVLYYMK